MMANSGSPRPHRLLFLAAILAFLGTACSATDADALLAFKATVSGGGRQLLNWDAGSSPCVGNRSDWAGVHCNNGAVMGLQLESMGLSGALRIDALVGLPGLRALSVMNNSLEGAMPEIKKLGALKSIFLSMNKLSGIIPADAFAGMGSLKKLYLAHNQFTGPIPSSLTGLSRLLELRMDGNGFTGGLPDLRQPELHLLNVSNNNLEGSIPEGLNKMEASLFQGNKGLCGAPLGVPCNPPSKSPSTPLLAAIVTVAVGAILAIIGAVFAVVRYRQGKKATHLGGPPSSSNSKTSSIRKKRLGRPPSSKNSKKVAAYREERLEQGPDEYGAAARVGEQARLVFVKALIKGDWERFELQDLLKASAEVLGGGGLGSSYKAILPNGPSVVVKRFKDMNAVRREEFQEHMGRLGSLSHPNLLPLVAYYYRREEKLLITDYQPNGSLADQLHGGNNRTRRLDWSARLKIVKGVARGLAYLYDALRMLSLPPHGHLTSTNVLLDESLEPLLSDYGLVPLTNKAHAAQAMAAYKAPEARRDGRTSKKSDVWSFGILVLEMLTGQLPDEHLRQGKAGTDLSSWVNSVIREEWTGEVFDSRMRAAKSCEGEMLKLLKVGLGCCERDVEKRWEMSEALDRVEELREADGDEDYSSYLSEGDLYSSRAMTEEGFSFTTNN